MCATVYGWRHLAKATDLTAGLAESNGSLPPYEWLKVTCGLTACTPGSAPGPTLGNEYGKTFPYLSSYVCLSVCHTPVLHRNGFTDRAVFCIQISVDSSDTVL